MPCTYVGCTRQHFKTRFYKHLGISRRTNRQFTSPTFSAPQEHCKNHQHPIKIPNLMIIDSSTAIDINTVESMHINILKPTLSNMQSSIHQLIVPSKLMTSPLSNIRRRTQTISSLLCLPSPGNHL